MNTEEKWDEMPGSIDMHAPDYNYKKKQAYTRQVLSPRYQRYLERVKQLYPYGSPSK